MSWLFGLNKNDPIPMEAPQVWKLLRQNFIVVVVSRNDFKSTTRLSRYGQALELSEN